LIYVCSFSLVVFNSVRHCRRQGNDGLGGPFSTKS
jgi:hypothetical protein